MNIDERFEKLEKQIKTLKKMLGGVAALALAALIGGTVLGVHAANGTFDTLTAKYLYLKDKSGKTRVMLSGRNGRLVLRDSRGKRSVDLIGVDGSLRLQDSRGKNRVVLSGHQGWVRTYKSNGQVKAELGKGSGSSGPHTHPVEKHKHTVKVTVN